MKILPESLLLVNCEGWSG